eukprot:79955-Chlamydomonas_euryale.AAC.1
MRCFAHKCRELNVRGSVVQSNVPGRAPAERDLSYQLCADDQALLCPSLPALQSALGVLQATARGWGFTIDFAKTKGMLMQPPTAPPVEALATFQLPGRQSVEVVSTFKYVGSVVQSCCTHRAAFHCRISSANIAFRMLRPLLRAGCRTTTCTKRILYNAYVLPALTYSAAGTWALTPSAWAAYHTVHNAFLREMVGTRPGPHCLSNDALYDRM